MNYVIVLRAVGITNQRENRMNDFDNTLGEISFSMPAQDVVAEIKNTYEVMQSLHKLNQELVEALKELLRVEATHDDGEIILEVARHNAKAALAKARGTE